MSLAEAVTPIHRYRYQDSLIASGDEAVTRCTTCNVLVYTVWEDAKGSLHASGSLPGQDSVKEMLLKSCQEQVDLYLGSAPKLSHPQQILNSSLFWINARHLAQRLCSIDIVVQTPEVMQALSQLSKKLSGPSHKGGKVSADMTRAQIKSLCSSILEVIKDYTLLLIDSAYCLRPSTCKADDGNIVRLALC